MTQGRAKERFRWVSPEGRRGRWRRSRLGAVMAAVAEHHSRPTSAVRVALDARASVALWPGLVESGWRLERGGLT